MNWQCETVVCFGQAQRNKARLWIKFDILRQWYVIRHDRQNPIKTFFHKRFVKGFKLVDNSFLLLLLTLISDAFNPTVLILPYLWLWPNVDVTLLLGCFIPISVDVLWNPQSVAFKPVFCSSSQSFSCGT